MLAGGVVNGIYPTYQPRQVEHALSDSNCRFLFVEDEEQLDKYLEIEASLPNVERVFVFDWRGLRGFRHLMMSKQSTSIQSIIGQGFQVFMKG